MQKLIDKAHVLIEALPYIQRFRGEIIVVKFGGSAMEDPAHVRGVLQDVAFMECVGMLPVIVHGGGKAISRGMQASGIEARFVHGLRVTCAKTIKVVQKVLKQDVNPGIVTALLELGSRARPLYGERILRVVRKAAADPETGQPIDFGFVGEPVNVDAAAIRRMLARRVIPVITPLGRGADGKLYNVNADAAAAAVARALKARKLVYLSDVPGLLRDAKDPHSVITTVKTADVKRLAQDGVISGGMLPKITSAVAALHHGVRKVHMIDGRMPHSLLLEIFTDKGVGTEIVQD